jgi:hypothetical protein
LAGLVLIGLDTAQMMIVPVVVPFDEIEVKNPGSCPEEIAGIVASLTRVTLGEVWICQMTTLLLPLVTTRPMPVELL